MNRFIPYRVVPAMVLFFGVVLAVSFPDRLSATVMGSATYQMTVTSLNGGGNTPSATNGGSGSFILGTTLSQSVPVGRVALSSYVNESGLWYAVTGSTTDTDGDGLPDALDDDDDNDGLLDIHETDTGTYVDPSNTGTNPLNADTDGDSFRDGDEVILGSNPLDSLSVPNWEPGDIAPYGAPDGVVDVADAMLAMRLVTGQTPTTQADRLRADVAPLGNPDGVLDVADAMLIMRKASGLASF